MGILSEVGGCFSLQKRSKSLRHLRENVCLTATTEDRLYAVGSQSHVTLVDDRLSRDVLIIASKQRGCGTSIYDMELVPLVIWCFWLINRKGIRPVNMFTIHTLTTDIPPIPALH